MTVNRSGDQDDGDLIRKVALDLIQRHGPKAPRVASSTSEPLAPRGHHTDANAWLAIAGAATEMLRNKPIMTEVLKFLRLVR